MAWQYRQGGLGRSREELKRSVWKVARVTGIERGHAGLGEWK